MATDSPLPLARHSWAENLAIKVVCPSCGQWVRLPEQEPVAPPDVSPEVLAEMGKQSKIVPADDEPKPASKPPEDPGG